MISVAGGLQILILTAAGLQIQQNKGIHLFGRICNPTVTNTSIFNARKQQAANKHNSKMWGVVYVADYKSLYSQLLDYKSSRTLFGRICNPTATNTSIFNARKQQEANKHNSKMWGIVYVADYKSLYSQLLDCKSSRTPFDRITNPHIHDGWIANPAELVR